MHRTADENELLGTLAKTATGEPLYLSNAFITAFDDAAAVPDNERFQNTMDTPIEETEQSLPLVKPEIEPEVIENIMEPVRMSQE